MEIIFSLGTFGMINAIGKSDFYVNGVNQLAAWMSATIMELRSPEYYAESINIHNFKAAACAFLTRCWKLHQQAIRHDPLTNTPDGTFFLNANTQAPYDQV